MGSLDIEQSFEETESLGDRVIYLGLSGLAIAASFFEKTRQGVVDYATQDDSPYLQSESPEPVNPHPYLYDCIATNLPTDRSR
jgi:hypothetical protein